MPWRPTAATDTSAAAVKQPERNSGFRKERRKRLLRAIQRPACSEQSRVLCRIRITEHHFLPVAAGGELSPVRRIVEQRAHHLWTGIQVPQRLEQWNDVETPHRRIPEGLHQATFASQQQPAQQIIRLAPPPYAVQA